MAGLEPSCFAVAMFKCFSCDCIFVSIFLKIFSRLFIAYVLIVYLFMSVVNYFLHL